MTADFIKLCQSVRLTRSESRIVDYILGHFREACFVTSTEIAEKLKISHSTVIRFSKDLGFSGYAELQSHIRQEYDAYISVHGEKATLPVERLNQNLETLSRDDLAEVVYGNVKSNLQSAYANNPAEILQKAARALVKARHKYIVGYRGSACVASFLSIMLRDTLPYVFCGDSSSISAADFLVDIGTEDALIAVGLPRYNHQTLCALRQAKEAGARIIVITDKLTSALAEYADDVLSCAVDSAVFFNSAVAAMFIAELLCTYVCKEVGKGNAERLNIINQNLQELKLY